MRRRIKRNFLEGLDMAYFVHALGAGILAGHDIAHEINSYIVSAVHPAFLPQRRDRSAVYKAADEPIQAFSKAKGIRIVGYG